MGRLRALGSSIGGQAHRVGQSPSTSAPPIARKEPWRNWYKLARWQRLRLSVFARDMFICQMSGCGRIIANTSLLVCDHRKAHRGNEALFWDEANLQTMCKPCHDQRKQAQEQADLHRRGVWD